MATRSSIGKIAAFLPAAAVYGVIFYLSSLETWPIEVGWSFFDKLAHGFIFGLLGAFLVFGFARGFSWRPLSLLWAALGIGAVLAGLDELHQLFVPGRDSSLWDALADVIGVALGGGLFLIFLKPGTRRVHPAGFERPGKPRL